MTRLITFITICLLLNVSNAFACDCNYSGPFYQTSKYSNVVALIKVTKYLTFKNIDGDKTPMSMEVEIIDIYKGKEERKKIVVWGDIGNLCRPYLSTFKESNYYVMALDKGNVNRGQPDEKDTDFSICDCGCYWLTVDYKTQIASGDIKSNNRSSISLDLVTIKSDFRQNSR